MKALLAEDAEFISLDAPLHGGARIAQLFYATRRRYGSAICTRVTPFNGEWGMLRFIGGVLESAQSFETDAVRIHGIHAQRNPDKLAHLRSLQMAGAGAVPAPLDV